MPGRRLHHKFIDHHVGFAVRIVRRLPAPLGRGVEIRGTVGVGCYMIAKTVAIVAHRASDHIVTVHQERDSVIRKSNIEAQEAIGWHRSRYVCSVTKSSRSAQKISIEALDCAGCVVNLYPVDISILVEVKLVNHERRHYGAVRITRKASHPGTRSPAPVVVDSPL